MFLRNRNHDSCEKNATGKKYTGILRIPAGITNLGGHDPENSPEKKNGKEGKPMPNHQIERQERHPTKTEACVSIERWEEGPRRKGKYLPKDEKFERPQYWGIVRWQEGDHSERQK